METDDCGPFVIDVASDAGPLDLDTYLAAVNVKNARTATSFVLRVAPALVDRLNSEDAKGARFDILKRVSGSLVRVQILTFADDGLKLFQLAPDGLVAESLEVIDNVRHADLRRLVREHEDLCYYRSNPHHHYIAPSMKHCSAFFRLGDAIRSRDALDRLAFWLQVHVVGSDALLIDTWSISSAVLRALQMRKADTPFDCLSNHPQQDRSGAETILRGLIDRMREGGKLTCIISVSSSGRYAEMIREICRGLHVDNVECVAIYSLASEGGAALSRLDLAPENHPAGECPLCQRGSSALALHPGLYYLKEFPEVPVTLGLSHFPPYATAPDSLTFLTRHHQLPKLLSVHHHDQHQRHHAFHVDVSVLLGHHEFIKRYENVLDTLSTKPDVIITPADDVSVEMGKIAAGRLGCPRVALDSLRNIERLSVTDRKLVLGHKHFLIIDDVLVSGSRLSAHNAALRQRDVPPASVKLVVGLGRPSSAADWKKHQVALTRNVGWPAELIAVETIYLPDWESPDCPWCREYEFLSGIAGPLPDPPSWLTARVAALSERERGIRDHALWLLPGVESRNLAHGSLVGPEGMSPIATLFSFAAALQRLRNDESKPLNPHFPDFRVFDVRNLTNYSEALLRAVILRAVRPKEWGLSRQRQQLVVELLAYAEQEDQDIILGELFLAIVRGAIDRTLATKLARAFKPARNDTYELLLDGLRRY